MKRLLTILAGCVAVSACSTPQPVVEQAQHGVSLIAELETSLAEYRRLQGVSQGARYAAIRMQRDAIGETEVLARRDARARAAAGDKLTVDMAEGLIAHADAIAADDAAYLANQAADQAALASLLAPIPSTRSASTDAQAALAVMADELTAEQRREELKGWIKEIRKNVSENRDKIEKAEAAAKAKGGM
jgi:hypothetical protein